MVTGYQEDPPRRGEVHGRADGRAGREGWPPRCRCSGWARALHARNCATGLGGKLDSPVDAVVCRTPVGATPRRIGLAIRLAEQPRPPVLNMARTKDAEIRAMMAEVVVRERAGLSPLEVERAVTEGGVKRIRATKDEAADAIDELAGWTEPAGVLAVYRPSRR